MKRTFLTLGLVLLSASAFADTYQVTFGWMDSTVYLPSDSPVYKAKYRVNGGTETVITGLSTPGGSVTVMAVPGQPIDMAAQACNLTLCSAWTGWVTATAAHPATQPVPQTGFTITVIRTGP